MKRMIRLGVSSVGLAAGLDVPWDIAFLSSTRYLLTDRPGRLRIGSTNGGALRTVRADFSDLRVEGEAGLLGLALDPRFGTNRLFHTCQSDAPSGDNRVIRWRLSADHTSAVRVGAPVITGIPGGVNHNGCRVIFGPDGKLWVSTGDAFTGPVPQDRNSLGFSRTAPRGTTRRSR